MRHRRTKLDSHDVIPEILELLKARGLMRTVHIKDEMAKVAARKDLVYRDEQVSYALAILKMHGLAMNVSYGIWSTTGEGAAHSKIAKEEALKFTRDWKVRIGKINASGSQGNRGRGGFRVYSSAIRSRLS